MSWSYGKPDGTGPMVISPQGGVLHWFGFNVENLYKFFTKGKELYSRTGELEDSNIFMLAGQKTYPGTLDRGHHSPEAW